MLTFIKFKGKYNISYFKFGIESIGRENSQGPLLQLANSLALSL